MRRFSWAAPRNVALTILQPLHGSMAPSIARRASLSVTDDINSIVNDLSPEARTAAQRAADMAGVPLEQWLARVILHTSMPGAAVSGGPEAAPPETSATDQPRGQPYVASRGALAAPTPQLAALRRYIASATHAGSAGSASGGVAIGLLEHRIAKKLGVKCVISERAGAGAISLHYESLAERLRLLRRLGISHPDW